MATKHLKPEDIVFQPHSKDARFRDLTGQTFGRLTVIGFAGRRKSRSRWFCKCQCGNVTCVTKSHLLSKDTQSCGCLHSEITKERMRGARFRNPKEYRSFMNAKARCTNPNHSGFHRYGARNILFRFESFEEFVEHVGKRPSPKHTLDRIDNNGHYEKGNVRWATATEQAQNRRGNRPITIDGQTKLLCQWAKLSGKRVNIIHNRLDCNWCARCAVFNPSRVKCNHKNHLV